MKRLLSIFACITLLTGCHLENFPWGGEDPVLTVKVVTADALEVDFSSARLEASFSVENAESEGGLAYFYYAAAAQDAPETEPAALAKEGTRLKAGSVTVKDSTFCTALTNLDPSTGYRFVATLLIDGQEFLGEVKSFTTAPKPGEMSVTGKADEITEVSAQLSGFAYPPSDVRSFAMGILCSTEQEPDFNNSLKLVATQMNVKNKYTVSAQQLIPDTTYYFRSFLQYGTETRLGDTERFRTLKLEAQVATAPATDAGLYNATLHGSLQVKSQADLEKDVWFLYAEGAGTDLAALKEKGKKLPATLEADGQFSGSLTLLQADCEYRYVACAKVYDRELYGEVQGFSTQAVSASIATGQASEIGLFTATLSATLTVDNQEDLSPDVWFLYIEEGQQEGRKLTASQAEDGSYICRLTGLKYNTAYRFVAGAKVQEKEFYGKEVSFRTEDIRATVTSGDASELGLFKATLAGTLKVDNPESLPREAWFLYGRDTSLSGLQTHGTRVKAQLDQDGAFTYKLIDLVHNTEYSFAAVAKVYDKEVFGKLMTFRTDSIKTTVVTVPATDIGLFRATLNGTLKVDNPETLEKEVCFLYGRDSTLSGLKARGTRVTAQLAADGSFKKEVSGLELDSDYSFVSCARIKGQEFYGEVAKFTTMDLEVKVTTGGTSKLDHFSATVTATVKVENEEALSKSVWFMVGSKMDKDTLLVSGTRFDAKRTDETYSAVVDSLKTGYLEIDKEYYYLAAAEIGGKKYYGDVKAFTTKDYAYLPAGDVVDMGVSVNWCGKNLGATAPEDSGAFVSWAEIQPRKATAWTSYKWADGDVNNLKIKKYCRNADAIYWYRYPSPPDNKTTMESADDIASVKLGEGWRIPSPAEVAELFAQSIVEKVTLNGVEGFRFTSKVNGNKLFIPAADGYWTNALDPDNSFNAVNIYIGTAAKTQLTGRFKALPVRPVKNK